MKCSEHFHGTVMASLAYPAVGWEPIMETDDCELEKGHEGKHRGKLIEWETSNTEPDPASSPIPCGACPPCLNGVESECESSPASEPRVLFDTPEATMWSDGVLRIQESNTESKP